MLATAGASCVRSTVYVMWPCVTGQVLDLYAATAVFSVFPKHTTNKERGATWQVGCLLCDQHLEPNATKLSQTAVAVHQAGISTYIGAAIFWRCVLRARGGVQHCSLVVQY
jgi:hypothetical protein